MKKLTHEYAAHRLGSVPPITGGWWGKAASEQEELPQITTHTQLRVDPVTPKQGSQFDGHLITKQTPLSQNKSTE